MQNPSETQDHDPGKKSALKKELGLWDVYSIATGAMFSSGFFLLPGIATAQSGPSAVLAYLVAGVLILPSMLSMLELATALPRAGGAYYFLDRSLGPAVGTVAGMGSWLTLVFKSAFALVGMGAYLAISPGIGSMVDSTSPGGIWLIKALAVVMAVVFVLVNILGAKESTRVQSFLVVTLLAVLGMFLVQGLWHVFAVLPIQDVAEQFTPFLHQETGISGFLATIGLVFVSFGGLTKVASISEEVDRPERNLPLGMFLSLGTAMVVYVLGVFVMIAVLDPGALRQDLAPVATAAKGFLSWLPGDAGVILVILAALAAFTSTGNAGILSASRYPLAMARDRLLPERFEKLGRFQTPSAGILITGGAIVLFIVVFSARDVAKLGSTFNLMVLALVNVAVLVMRESRIDTYDPGYSVPFYPWVPLAGILVNGWLIIEMGATSIAFSLGVAVLGAIWYFRYARPRVDRYGAVHHVFARLGRYRHAELLPEFREIMKEKGLRDEDPFDDIVQRAAFFEVGVGPSMDDLIQEGVEKLAERIGMDAGTIREGLQRTGRYGGAPMSLGIVLLHLQTPEVEQPEMVLARAREGLCVTLPSDDPTQGEERSCDVFAVVFLVSPESKVGQHLRVLAQLADRAEDPAFRRAWRRVEGEKKLKELLLRDARFLEVLVSGEGPTRSLIGARIHEIDLPPQAFVATVRRGKEHLEPSGLTELEPSDALTIIGSPEAISRVFERYVEKEENP